MKIRAEYFFVIALILFVGYVVNLVITTESQRNFARKELVGKTLEVKKDDYNAYLTITSVVTARTDYNKQAWVTVAIKIIKSPSITLITKVDTWSGEQKLYLRNESGVDFLIPKVINHEGWELHIYYEDNFEVK